MSIRERIAAAPKRAPVYEAWGERRDGKAQIIKSSEVLEEVERAIDEYTDRFVRVYVFKQELLMSRAGGLESEHVEGGKRPEGAPR